MGSRALLNILATNKEAVRRRDNRWYLPEHQPLEDLAEDWDFKTRILLRRAPDYLAARLATLGHRGA
jgi:hypothetical protein